MPRSPSPGVPPVRGHHGRPGRTHHGRPQRPRHRGGRAVPAAAGHRRHADPADKALLQTLGLDLTEHAGHDYVEVVLHTPEDVTALRRPASATTSASPTWSPARPRTTGQRGLRRRDDQLAAAVGPGRLPHAGRLQRRHGGAESDHPGMAKRFALPHESLDGRTIYGIEIGKDVQGARRRAAHVRAARRAPRPGVAVRGERDGVRRRPGEELRHGRPHHRPGRTGPACSSCRWSTSTASSCPAPTAGWSTSARSTAAAP